jgi:hypothetical protein
VRIFTVRYNSNGIGYAFCLNRIFIVAVESMTDTDKDNLSKTVQASIHTVVDSVAFEAEMGTLVTMALTFLFQRYCVISAN